MADKRTVTLNGLTLPNTLFVIVNIAMILVGAYMTKHFFDVHFPTGIEQASSICNINQFWSCDKATNSPLGMIFNVPTSLIAIILGVYGLICAFVGSEETEKNLKLILLGNFIVCILLGVYSLMALGGLCLMCTVYYVLSGFAVFIFSKWSELKPSFQAKPLTIFLAVLIIPSAVVGYTVNQKKILTHEKSHQYVEQFNKLNSYGDPGFESPYKLAKATENFADAPIQVTLFSDFQCPFCQSVATQFEEIAKEFKGKINIQYMFYPLDMTCNKDMKGSLHPYACQAAYLAACSEEKFVEIHDYIFANQKDINKNNLLKWEKDFGLSGCLENKDLQDLVQQTLNTGKFYKIKSTPTIIINGKKIEGGIDTPIMKAILKSLL